MPRSAHLLVALFAIATAVSACATSYRPLIEVEPPTERLLITDVRVFTGASDTEVLEHQDVLIAGGRIEAISPTSADRPDQGVVVIDGEGKTLLPGLIDAHVHLTSNGASPGTDFPTDLEHNLHAHLYAGVTTVFDLGGDAGDLSDLRDDVRDGELLGPRIYHTHIPTTVQGSHPIPAAKAILGPPVSWIVSSIVPQIERPEDAEGVIEDLVEEGVDYIKLIADQIPPGSPEMSDAVLVAAIEAALAREMKVIVHAGSIEKALVAAKAGATALAHHTWRTPISPEQAAELQSTGVHYIPTLAGWTAVAEMTRGAWTPTPLDRAITPQELIGPVEGKNGKTFAKTEVTGEMAVKAAEMEPTWAPGMKALVQAGVPMLVGTDSALPGAYPGSAMHRELQLMASMGGMTPTAVLYAATGRAAAFIGGDVEGGFGTVKPGRVADLVLVEGDPTTKLEDISNIVLVFKGGARIKPIQP